MRDGDVELLLDKLDPEQRVRLLTGSDTWRTRPEPDVGLREIVFSDGPAGVRGPGWDERFTSALLPSPTALGALWDEDRVRRLGELLGDEARRKGVHVVLAPTLNLHRSPLAGRHFECFAEDPLLAGRSGAALIRGVQSRGVAATAKHYVANDSETERLTVDVQLDERVLRELYLAPFEAAVQAGVWLVMSAYNKVNGVTMSESSLLAEPLKGEWGFDGVVVSDWGGVRSTVASAVAAQDLAMPGPRGPWGAELREALASGRVPAEAVEDKARRLLRLASRVGTLIPGGTPPNPELDPGSGPGLGLGSALNPTLGEASSRALAVGPSQTPSAPAPAQESAPAPAQVPTEASAPTLASAQVPAEVPTAASAPAPAPASAPAPVGGAVLRAVRRLGVGAGRGLRPRPGLPPGALRQELRGAAAASFVLLKNRGVLPLDEGALGRGVAVIGVHADEPRVQGGGSSEVFPQRVVSPLEGLRSALGPDVRVSYEAGPAPEGGGGQAPLGARYGRDPEGGAPGVRLRVLDADGAVLCSAHQPSGRVLEPELPPGAHTVELAAVLHPDTSGTWTLGLGGFGALRLSVEGTVVLDGEFPPETADPAVIHVRPPQHTARIPLTAGNPVHVVARRELAPGTGRATVLTAAPPLPGPAEALAAAVAAARAAAVAVVVVGTTEGGESEGFDRTSLRLPVPQDELVAEIVRANPRTVVVVNSGGPVELPWREAAGAILLTWFPGQEGGHALADVLLGRAEPGGRLPTTWPAALADAPVRTTRPLEGQLPYEEGLHIGHRGWLRRGPAGPAPAYWFGHGLGYTTWEFERLGTPEPTPGGGYEVPVLLHNTGTRRGREVVQIHLSRPDSAIERPVRWLAGWVAAEAEPGERVTAYVRIPARALQHWSPQAGGWTAEPGWFAVLAGRSAGDLPLRGAIEV
ncbi:glycoside hydrolase family 3 C-terminal domain-containing protein [Streptomyces sp. AP-93]|uniref:glycoside hydrolase family 3 C-terminal domain-containing protein n=1 Tax=Streptomyces sp. AP-93 TaxID=2929048 RepID=UPI001FAF29C5|nr:glycoside hydrolase family 3 C-terminal domain-containing protein [Streptomyces sp. AP-93]MCJ0875859.1 glycoside hydrolase family 3 C-terminal domain-containing protein [Streptomyces sp. AP-93]